MRRLGRLRALRNAYLRRGIVFWVGIRFAALFVGVAVLGPVGAAGIVALVALVSVLEARRRWEDVLLGNLGIPLRSVAAWSIPVPLVLESTALALVRALLPGAPESPLERLVTRVAAPTGGGWSLLPAAVPFVSGPGEARRELGEAILMLDGIGKSFGRKTVLKAASFHARPGTLVALMGRNGSGKTTMMRIAVGRVRAEWGRVQWRGRSMAPPRLHRMAREGLFFSAQESALTPLFTVREHLEALALTFGGGERTGEVVERMRLGEFMDRKPPSLSGGERQRTSLAMALMRRPVCLLMDEPFAGVAPRDRPLIADGLRLLRDAGCAVVVSGHDVDDLFLVADQVMWVVAGTTHWLGAPEEAARHPQFLREYLGPGGR